ncbi:MAG: hypothetical protein D6741_07590 [Planctomycetota bacterium]|nr:MAG: hypothetical protein D6741_07590 [Planctomycetota bacterium]
MPHLPRVIEQAPNCVGPPPSVGGRYVGRPSADEYRQGVKVNKCIFCFVRYDCQAFLGRAASPLTECEHGGYDSK